MVGPLECIEPGLRRSDEFGFPPRFVLSSQVGVAAGEDAAALSRVVHLLDAGDRLLEAVQLRECAGLIPEVLVRVEWIEPHRAIEMRQGVRREAGMGKGIPVLGDRVGIVRVQREGSLITRERAVVLLAIELDISEFGVSARIVPSPVSVACTANFRAFSKLLSRSVDHE